MRSNPSIALLLSAATCLPGCIAIYGHRDVVVEVTDFETGQAVAGARVSAYYSTMFVVRPPKSIEVTTPDSGRLPLRVATYQDGGHWRAWKEGYLSDRLDSPFRERARDDAVNGDRIRLQLLKKPQPTATFLMPEGFSGLLRLEFEPQPIIPGPITRLFRITVPPDGFVRIRQEGGLQVVNWHESACQYPDGTLIDSADLSRKPDPEQRGKFWLGFGPNRSMYFIGTAREARKAFEWVNDVEYDELGGMTIRDNEAHFQAAFENPGILD